MNLIYVYLSIYCQKTIIVNLCDNYYYDINDINDRQRDRQTDIPRIRRSEKAVGLPAQAHRVASPVCRVQIT